MQTQADYAKELLKRSASLRDAGRLVYRDVGSDVPSHIRALDVFLATAVSRSEGISTTVLEAMSTGLPVVSTDVGAIREAVVHGDSGYVVPADDPTALARHVTALVLDSAGRIRMGNAARERAESDFDVDRCADVHAAAFEAALARAAR